MILGLSWRLNEVHVKYLTQHWARLALNKVKLESDVVNYCLCTWLFLWYMDLRIIYLYCYFSLFIFNILVLLGYSCLWCCVSLSCTAEWFSYTGPCIHSFFRFFSHIDYHGILGWYFSKIFFSAILLWIQWKLYFPPHLAQLIWGHFPEWQQGQCHRTWPSLFHLLRVNTWTANRSTSAISAPVAEVISVSPPSFDIRCLG